MSWLPTLLFKDFLGPDGTTVTRRKDVQVRGGARVYDDPATRRTVIDLAAPGFDFKESVRAATTAALAANTRTENKLTATANGALGAIDGVTLAVGEALLVKDEAAGENNGVYVVTELGDGSSPWILTRREDFDSSDEVKPGLMLVVEEGATNSDTLWVLATNGPIVLNTTALAFSQLGPGAGLTAPANPADNGKLAIASGGDLAYFAGTAVGRVLTWNGTTWTSNVAVDLGAQSLTTTGLITAGGYFCIASGASAIGSAFDFRKSRGGGIVQTDDVLGNLNFWGHDGSTFQNAARIRASVVEGTPGAGAVESALDFLVGPNTGAIELVARISRARGFETGAFSYGFGFPVRSDEATVQTTDATPTELYAVTPADGLYEISVVVFAHESATGDSASFTRRAFFKIASGAVTQVGSTLDVCEFKDAGAAAWLATISTDGTDIIVTVTGEAAHTIDWDTTIQYAELT